MYADSGDVRVAVAILSKAPVPGLAKTRLIPHIGSERAAAVQRWLLRRTVSAALQADVGPVSLWCAPDIDDPEFARCRRDGAVELHRQVDGDLGERMLATIKSKAPCIGTIVVGTDCPLLDASTFRAAAVALAEGNDAVLVPAEDGGYVLIGLRSASAHPFREIDWSTERVCAQTRLRLSELGWRWRELDTLWDVDRFADYQRLCRLFPQARRQHRPKPA